MSIDGEVSLWSLKTIKARIMVYLHHAQLVQCSQTIDKSDYRDRLNPFSQVACISACLALPG